MAILMALAPAMAVTSVSTQVNAEGTTTVVSTYTDSGVTDTLTLSNTGSLVYSSLVTPSLQTTSIIGIGNTNLARTLTSSVPGVYGEVYSVNMKLPKAVITPLPATKTTSLTGNQLVYLSGLKKF